MKKKLLLLAVPFLTLVSCQPGETDDSQDVSYLTDKDSGTATIKIFKDESATSTDRYISPKNVEVSMDYNAISGTLSNNENVCPSVGDVNLLVIPVHLPGSEFNTPEIKSDIETAFFGKESERNGFMSLSEYYYESSFGKLNFQGFVTDWFDVTQYTDIKELSDITMGNSGTIITEIFRKAVDWAFSNPSYNLNKADYDKNQDGSIDGVWLIYDHYNYFNQALINPNSSSGDLNESFWNYTTWDWGTPYNQEDPTTSGFSWASFDQLYSAYAEYDENDVPDFSDFSSIDLDSHTFIHETGHLLGLDDLYTSDGRRPTGSSTMMDQNIGDFDPYSKLALGWITPYVVYGSSEILLPYNTYNDHSVIVIPSNYEEISARIENMSAKDKENFVYEFNPFSEYILIDLYSPLGVAEQDTYGNEKDGILVHQREACVANTGVRIFHVDSRIFKCRVVNYDGGQNIYWDYNNLEWDGTRLGDDEAILMVISNERSESQMFGIDESYNYYERCRLIEANGTNTFDLSGLTSQYATRDTLWDIDSDPFDILTFGYQFFNGEYTFNDGAALPFKISVKTLQGVEYNG